LDLRGRQWQEAGKDFNNEELHNLYASSNVIREIKSGRMRWVGNVARTGDMRNLYILVGKN